LHPITLIQHRSDNIFLSKMSEESVTSRFHLRGVLGPDASADLSTASHKFEPTQELANVENGGVETAARTFEEVLLEKRLLGLFS
jgi:hypothetical protein